MNSTNETPESGLKNTKGDVRVHPQGRLVLSESNNIIAACGFVVGDEEAEANSTLIADAFNVANQTGLMPSQLLQQMDELVKDIEAAYLHIEARKLGQGLFEIRTALNRLKSTKSDQ